MAAKKHWIDQVGMPMIIMVFIIVFYRMWKDEHDSKVNIVPQPARPATPAKK